MEITQAVKALSALAQESRLEIFRLLVASGDGGLPAGQIGERLAIPAATLSFHLKELSNAGLIGQCREGRSIIYSLNVEVIRSLLCYLMKDCCQGKPELCQPDFADSECCDATKKGKRKPRKKRQAAS